MNESDAEELVREAVYRLVVHQRGHAMWLTAEEVKPEEPLGPCPYCGVTLQQMYQAAERGSYICSLAGWRMRPEAKA